MNEIIQQCCYTNAIRPSGNRVSSGWQTVAVTEDLPSGIYANCSKYQSANSTIQGRMADEQGNVLNLLEFHGDGSHAYAVRTRYGLTDRLGRPNMFSHAYIFPWKQDGRYADPNDFLTLTQSNFTDNEEAALGTLARTGLDRREPFSLPRALELAGLDRERYITLIQCVYIQYTERRAPKPLYIGYDGSEEQMLAILYCIYSGLPFSIRRNLSVASAPSNSTTRHNIIFSIQAERRENHIIPATGENNVLNLRQQRKVKRSGYIDHALKTCPLGDRAAYERYFERLEECAMIYGDPTASNDLILKIAWQLQEEPNAGAMSMDELDSRLSDALRSKSFGNVPMEHYISMLLAEVLRRNEFLTEESEATLKDRLRNPATGELKQTGFDYFVHRIKCLPPEKAAQELADMAETPIFADYRRELNGDYQGQDILEHYYLHYYLEIPTPTWEFLHQALQEARELVKKEAVLDEIRKMGVDLYRTALSSGVSGPIALAAYETFLQASNPEDWQTYLGQARQDYWNLRKENPFQWFDTNAWEEYRTMAVDHPVWKLYQDFVQTLRTYERGESEFLWELNHFVCTHARDIRDDNTSQRIGDIAFRECSTLNQHLYQQGRTDKLLGESFLRWLELAIGLRHPQMFQQIERCRQALLRRDTLRLKTSFESFRESLDHSGLNPNARLMLRRQAATALLKEAEGMDTPAKPISLDNWLILSESMYNNSFEVFDHHSPAILDLDPARVAEESSLLNTHPYRSHCRYYIENRGREYETVRMWRDIALNKRQKQTQAAQAASQSPAGRTQAPAGRTQPPAGRPQPPQTTRMRGGRYPQPGTEVPTQDVPSRWDRSQNQNPYPMTQDPPPQPEKKSGGFLGGLFGRKK